MSLRECAERLGRVLVGKELASTIAVRHEADAVTNLISDLLPERDITTSLRAAWQRTVDEPVPHDMHKLMARMKGMEL